MKILIVEDNIKTANFLQLGLKENLFLADVALNGQEGLFLALEHQYDVIILDIMLPDLDGWSLIQKIRSVNKETSILFLTACDHVNDRVKGLDLGADDYLVKPFAFTELLARIRTLLRRKSPQPLDIITIANLRIEVRKHKAYRENKLIHLSAKEFMLLLLLASRQGEVLSRSFIAEQVWGINFDTDTNAIDVAIKRLRDKVDNEFEKKLIHTVRSRGYVLEDC
jgi:two-component system copper resistance phosphate regulon response regulator CusR